MARYKPYDYRQTKMLPVRYVLLESLNEDTRRSPMWLQSTE